jgi:DEAD/DEAH box helicase domain-containing protein
MQGFLNSLLNKRWQGFKVAHHAALPAVSPKYSGLSDPLPDPLKQVLQHLGIPSLYSHQSAALEGIRSGRNVVVATPTSSGKSLIYNLGVAEALLKDPELRALYLFPIKALSRDQFDSLEEFFQILESDVQFRTAIYDGDTTQYQRARIRQKHPHILLTNPDMLHYGLLPFHQKWEAFWRKLRFVIIDEMHTYRGVFGSHMAQIFRRLRRICRSYGSDPRFVFLSATIANPKELAEQLIGPDEAGITVIDENGAPQAARHFVFLESDDTSSGHVSTMAARLIVHAAEAGLKTIAFTQSRKLTELVHMSVSRMAPRLASRVSSYRAGFLPEERRTIEQKLAGGSLAAVISTSALELGIDIGGLDLCILVGYPGTVMNTWQRGGRVGRGGQESAIVLLPQPDALDQYIIHHPQEFLSSHYEIAVTDPKNIEILKAHLPCAAAELPLLIDQIELDSREVREALDDLTRSGALIQTADGREWLSSTLRPHRNVDIRSVGESFTILKDSDNGDKVPLGKSEGLRALKECHPGAVYLHRGESYHVERLDLEKHIIQVANTRATYFTRVKSEKETEILDVLASKPVENFIVRMGHLRVTEHITGYEKRQLFTQELLGRNPLDLPPQVFETVGFWMEIEPIVARQIQCAKLHFMGGIHAIEHAAISMFPLFALCDRNDIGGISCPHHPQVGKAAIFIYDGYPGGIGLAARGYEMILPLLRKTKDLMASCPCAEGCPACIHSPKCGAGNKPLDKAAALSILEYLVGEKSIAEGEPSAESDEPDWEQSPAVCTPEPERKAYRIGYFDLETQRLAGEVGGWQNKHLMRMSVGILYESPSDELFIYREEEIPRLVERLQGLDLVVGFNIRSFDYQVLKAYTPFDFGLLPTFDILQEIYKGLGFRLSLDHLGEKTLGRGKISDGIQAVQWFRNGEWEPLIQYCKEDVMLTRDLFSYALEKGHLLYSDRQNRLLRISTRWDLEKIIEERAPARQPKTRSPIRRH